MPLHLAFFIVFSSLAIIAIILWAILEYQIFKIKTKYNHFKFLK